MNVDAAMTSKYPAAPNKYWWRGSNPYAVHALGRVFTGLSIIGFLVGGSFWAHSNPATAEGTGFSGTLLVRPQEGEKKQPVAGVTVSVIQNNTEIASTTTNQDGTFFLAVPGEGTYTVTLRSESLPEGVTLRDPSALERTLTVQAAQTKGVAFPLERDNLEADSALAAFFGKLARLTFDGVRFGLILAMCSIGFSLIYGTTGLVNFAHGELVTLGAVAALWLDQAFTFLLAAAIALPIGALSGALNDSVIWRPLRKVGAGLVSMMMISIGLSIVIRQTALFSIGGDRQSYSKYATQTPFHLGPLRLTPRQLLSSLICIVVLVAVGFVLNRTRFGKAMRAVADNSELAETSGINVDSIVRLVWIGGGTLAALGGVLLGLDQQVRWDMGFNILLLIFAGVVLGGLGTSYGALVGSITVGVLIQLSTLVIAPELKNVGALTVLIVVLLIKPQGILGQQERVA